MFSVAFALPILLPLSMTRVEDTRFVEGPQVAEAQGERVWLAVSEERLAVCWPAPAGISASGPASCFVAIPLPAELPRTGASGWRFRFADAETLDLLPGDGRVLRLTRSSPRWSPLDDSGAALADDSRRMLLFFAPEARPCALGPGHVPRGPIDALHWVEARCEQQCAISRNFGLAPDRALLRPPIELTFSLGWTLDRQETGQLLGIELGGSELEHKERLAWAQTYWLELGLAFGAPVPAPPSLPYSKSSARPQAEGLYADQENAALGEIRCSGAGL
jgi:hypothetical protein